MEMCSTGVAISFHIPVSGSTEKLCACLRDDALVCRGVGGIEDSVCRDSRYLPISIGDLEKVNF